MKTFKSGLTVAVLIAASVFLTSCKDDEEVPSVEAQLMGAKKGWVITAGTISPAFLGITDFFSQYEDCDRDDALMFTSTTAYQVENSVKCSTSEPTISETGTWVLTSDKKTIQLKPAGDDPYEFKIVEVSASLLIVTQSDVLNGVTYTSRITFRPK